MKVVFPASFSTSIITFSSLLKEIFISSLAQNLFFELPKTFVIELASIFTGDSFEPFKYEFLEDCFFFFFFSLKVNNARELILLNWIFLTVLVEHENFITVNKPYITYKTYAIGKFKIVSILLQY